MEFNFVDLQICVLSSQPRKLLAALFSCGAAFASSCRALVCGAEFDNCSPCHRGSDCPWFTVFGQELGPDPEGVKRHQKPPLPFVFSFREAAVGPGTTGLQVSLVIVGNAIPYLGVLLKGFSRMLDSGLAGITGRVLQVSARDYQGNIHPLDENFDFNTSNNLPILASSDVLLPRGEDSTAFGLRIKTPLRLVKDGRTLRRFEGPLFLRSLLRRVSSIAYHYGEGGDDRLDFRELSDFCGTVDCNVVEGVFHQTWLGIGRFSGFTGSIRLTGVPRELAPFLLLGSRIHTGKGATWGFGEYALYSVQELV